MKLKDIVDDLLKERERSLSWLAQQVGKTFDGFRLSLIKESVKYTDLKKIAEVLEISPNVLFGIGVKYTLENGEFKTEEFGQKYTISNSQVEMYKQLTESLKNQLKDKDKIIELLTKKN